MTPDARRDRRGFSMVEMLVVAILGAFIVMAAYQVLVTNQRTATVNTANILGQQTVRAGMDVLFSELREISPGGGDLLRMDGDSVTIRVMRTAGIVCDSTTPGASDNYRWGVIPLGDSLLASPADSVWLFADHDYQSTSDDVWGMSSVVALVDPSGFTCGDHELQGVRFSVDLAAVGGTDWNGDGVTDTISIGSLLRKHEVYTYGLGVFSGSPYLIRARQPGGSAVPLVGPLMSGTGLSFEYLDSDGNVTNVAANVAQMVVTLRTQHEARDAQGDLVTDSLKTRIYLRN